MHIYKYIYKYIIHINIYIYIYRKFYLRPSEASSEIPELIYLKNDCLFLYKKDFNADKYSMEKAVPWRNHVSTTQLHTVIRQCTCRKKLGETTPNSIQNYFEGSDCFSFHAYLCIVTMKNSVKIPLVSVWETSFGKPWTPVLFNDVTFIFFIVGHLWPNNSKYIWRTWATVSHSP